MKCPVCGSEMIEKDFGGVMVDVCDTGCKGIWLDWLELEKIDENHEGVGNALQEAMKHPRENDENRPPIKCPKCNIPMKQHKYKSSKETNIDECYNCGGFFLDSGELKFIRDTHMSKDEEKEYVEKLISEIPQVGEAKRNLKSDQLRAAALRKYSRFLRLSYLITGK